MPLDCVFAWFQVPYQWGGLPGTLVCGQIVCTYLCAVKPLDWVLHGSRFFTSGEDCQGRLYVVKLCTCISALLSHWICVLHGSRFITLGVDCQGRLYVDKLSTFIYTIYVVVPLDCVLARFYVHYPLSGLPGPVECRQTIYISICAVDPLDSHGSMFLTANLFRMEKCSQVAN